MLRKTITYEDYNGEKRTEVFFFNLTKTELTRWDIVQGNLAVKVKEMIDNNSQKDLLQLFEDLITMAYGRPSDDGKYFKKTPQMKEEFMACPAYDELFMELVGDSQKFSAFLSALIPKDLAEEMKKQEIEEAKKNALDHNTETAAVG